MSEDAYDRYLDRVSRIGMAHGKAGKSPRFKNERDLPMGKEEAYQHGYQIGRKEHESHNWGSGKGNPHGDTK